MRVLLCLIFLLAPHFPLEKTLLSPQKLDRIREGQKAVMNGQWDNAYRIFEDLHADDSADPAGYIFRAAVLQSEMMDREENVHGRQFRFLCDSARYLAENWLTCCTPRDSALCYLYLGHQYAFRSLYEARFASRLAALSLGLKAKGQYRKGLRTDSTVYDLYLGLGSYHYWKSVSAGILRTAGIFKDERKRGIAEIKLAADSSLFSGDAAASALIWVMINEENYDSSVSLSLQMLALYPDGNSFLWPLGESYYRSGKFAEAAQVYDRLFEGLKIRPGNFYNLIESAYWFCRAAENIGDTSKTGEIVSFLDSAYDDIPKSIRRKQRSRLAFLMRRKK
jgi:tetratricopeptide (TPR) repeat protein